MVSSANATTPPLPPSTLISGSLSSSSDWLIAREVAASPYVRLMWISTCKRGGGGIIHFLVYTRRMTCHSYAQQGRYTHVM